MTWDQIRKLYAWLPESSTGYHQHPNGSGWVRDSVTIDDGIYVGEKAIIDGGTIRGGTIYGGTIDRSPLLIFGSRYWIGFSRPGHIASGCVEKPVDWWLEHVERCAEDHGYSDAEQKEYRLYVEMIAKWMELHGLATASVTEPETIGNSGENLT